MNQARSSFLPMFVYLSFHASPFVFNLFCLVKFPFIFRTTSFTPLSFSYFSLLRDPSIYLSLHQMNSLLLFIHAQFSPSIHSQLFILLTTFTVLSLVPYPQTHPSPPPDCVIVWSEITMYCGMSTTTGL